MTERDPFLLHGTHAGVGRYDGVSHDSPQSGHGAKPWLGQPFAGAEFDPENLNAGRVSGWPVTGKPRPERFPAESLLAMTVAPWSVFVMVACAYAFFPTGLAWRAVASSIAGACLAFALVLLYVYFTRQYVAIYLHLGLLCIVAVVLGRLVGNDIFQREVLQHRLHQARAAFANVAPTDPAAAFQDAAIIGFSDATAIDLFRVLGHHPQGGGTTYCVAPIVNETHTGKVQFWAVGVDCCEPLRGFHCDDAQDPQARSGLVVSSGESSFDVALYGHFQRATKQAAALYHLSAADHPVFVRWVKEAGSEKYNGLRDGIVWVVALCFLYFMTSIMVAVWLHWLSNYRR